MYNDRTRSSSITLIDFPAEFKQCLCRCRYTMIRPREEVELRHCARLAGLDILQIEAANEVVVTPNMLTY